MSELELAIWSAASGAIALVVLVCVADVLMTRSQAAIQGAGYNISALFFVVLLSGLPRVVVPDLSPAALHVLQVLIGPLCAFLGDYFVRGWLGARHRDRFMNTGLLTAGVVMLIGGVLIALVVPEPQQLVAAAILITMNTVLVVWMCVRAWMLGDRLALGLAIGSVLMVISVSGLYALALRIPGIGALAQATLAIICVACLSMIGAMLWKRNSHERRVTGFEPVHSQYDPVTKLRAGAPFVRQLIKAQERRKLTRREGAVIAVMIFQPERIVAQAGSPALNEVYMQIAQRLQRQVGVVNPVGRYWDRCFVVLAESIHSPAALRTMGLRVASALRRPMQVSAEGGGTANVRADIGVGVVHLGRDPMAVEDLLHEAQRLAEAARAMASRAAMLDPVTGQIVPVEHAQLGKRRRGKVSPALHAIAPSHRVRV